MAMNEDQVERELQATGNTAPRLTPEHIERVIVSSQYYRFPGTTLTVCAITLRNGYTITGESAAASAANFDVSIGQKIAYDNARAKIWALEGYLLRQQLAAAEQREP